MKIALIADWFSENMGYADYCLSKALARLGHEVHVITSTAQIYYSSPIYKEVYESFLGPGIVSPGTKNIDGFLLHRLPIGQLTSVPTIQGLQEYLADLAPDVIQTFDVVSESTFDSAQVSSKKGIKLFTASHMHASVFNPKPYRRSWKRKIRELFMNDTRLKRLRFVNNQTIRCFPISADAARIAEKYFQVPQKKIRIHPLGVDTELFYPPDEKSDAIRKQMRTQIGLDSEDLLCVYTGRFTKDKNPYCLAQAIEHLQNHGEKIFGLFVGSGSEEERNEIGSKKGCFMESFVPVKQLNKFYWMSDAGVWPSQESTSQLDAMSCGLPLILSDRIEVKERVEGNGFVYEHGNYLDLAKKILLLKDSSLLKKMSATGIQKIKEHFNWQHLAEERIKEYS